MTHRYDMSYEWRLEEAARLERAAEAKRRVEALLARGLVDAYDLCHCGAPAWVGEQVCRRHAILASQGQW